MSELASELVFMVRFNQTPKINPAVLEHEEDSMIFRTIPVTLQDVRDMQTICRLHMAMEVERIVAEGITHQLLASDVAYSVLECSTDLTDILEALTFCEGLLINSGKSHGTLALSESRYTKLLGNITKKIGHDIMKRATGEDMRSQFKDLEENRVRMAKTFVDPGYMDSSVTAQVAQLTPKDPTLN